MNYDYSAANISSAEYTPINYEKARLQLYSCYQIDDLHRNERGTLKCNYIVENFSKIKNMLNRVEHRDVLYEIILKLCRITPLVQLNSQSKVKMDSGTP